MRYAIIENGIVTNVVESDIPPVNGASTNTGNIGDTYSNGVFTPPADPLPTVADYTAAVQAMLDRKAQERGYDGILSLASYAASSNPPFAAEGDAGLEWRDAVWLECYRLMALVQGGQMAQPTVAELLGMLPTMSWPA